MSTTNEVKSIKVGDVSLQVPAGSMLAKELARGDRIQDGIFEETDMIDAPNLEWEAHNGGTKAQRFLKALSYGFQQAGVIKEYQRPAFEYFFTMREKIADYRDLVSKIWEHSSDKSRFWDEFELDCAEWNTYVAPMLTGGAQVYSRGEVFWVMANLAGMPINHIPTVGRDCFDTYYGLTFNEHQVPEIIRGLYLEMVENNNATTDQIEAALGDITGQGFTVSVEDGCDGSKRKVELPLPVFLVPQTSKTEPTKGEEPTPCYYDN